MIVLIIALIAGQWATAAEVKFEEGPVAKKKGDGALVGFKLSAPTDVEVSVLNSKGEIVRHLAAGVLGNPEGSGQVNPPPAPLRPGLTQVLEWDGTDDKGKPAQGGPFSFRVRTGIKPEFDKFMFHHPDSMAGQVMAVAVGPKGTLYLFQKHATYNTKQGSHNIGVYARDGKFLYTLKPFAADIPQARAKGTGAFSDDDGRVVPRIDNWQQLNFYPDPVNKRGRSMPDSASPAVVDSKGRVYWIGSGAGVRLMALDADGGSPYEDFLGPNVLSDDLLKPDAPRSERLYAHNACLGMSSDDKHVYLSGFVKGWYAKDQVPHPPCVLRIPVASRGNAETFLGDPEKAGTEGGLLTEPRGVVAAKGLVYVADRGADRVVVFNEKDGAYVGDLAVPAPDTIGVDPETGAIYVASHGDSRKARLVKFDGYKNGKELYSIKFPGARGKQRIAVDATANPVRIWCPQMHYGPGFTCIEDTGDGFKILGDPRSEASFPRSGPTDLNFDRVRDELYVKFHGQQFVRVSEETGEVTQLGNLGLQMGAYATQILPHEDGSLITLSWKHGLKRWTRDGKPLPWEGQEDNNCPWGGIMTYTQNYLALHGDEIYAIPPTHYRDKKKKGRFNTLNVFGLDLKEKRTAIWQVTQGTIPRVDAKGNIYLASQIRPVGRTWPEFFDDKLEPVPDELKFSSEYWYSYMYGGIAKFPPEGGAIWFKEGEIPACAVGEPSAELLAAPKTEFGFHFYWKPKETGALLNAEWFRFGFSPYSETYPIGTPTCMCEGAGFDVDAWGRIFYPNLGQFRVEMIDNNNNWIGTFGHYGNKDSVGGGKATETAYQHESSERSHPDIPLAWPTYVAVSDKFAYVNDTLSSRIVRVRLNAELTETVAVP